MWGRSACLRLSLRAFAMPETWLVPAPFPYHDTPISRTSDSESLVTSRLTYHHVVLDVVTLLRYRLADGVTGGGGGIGFNVRHQNQARDCSRLNTNPNPKVRKSGAVGKAVLASMVLKSAGRWDHRALRWTGACYWNGVGGFMFNSS